MGYRSRPVIPKMVANIGPTAEEADARHEPGAYIALEGHLYEVVRYERTGSGPLSEKLYVRDCKYPADDTSAPITFLAHVRACRSVLVRPAPTGWVPDFFEIDESSVLSREAARDDLEAA